MSKSVVRSVKNLTKGYSSTEVKVRDATSNDSWGPSGTQMGEIAQMTYDSGNFTEVMDMLDKRLNDKGKNWRHVLKSLKVLDYCLHEGSELCCTWARKNIYIIKTLREFQYIDEESRDVGLNVRQSAKELTSLIMDEDRLRLERADRKNWKSRVTGLEDYGPPAGAPPAEASTPSRSRRTTGQRRTGGTSEEDDLEMRLALEASKNQMEEDEKRRGSKAPVSSGDDDDLAKAIRLSEEEDAARRRELENKNASLLFDDNPTPTAQQPQATGWNQGFQQGGQVDWFGNPIDQQQQQQPQSTGYLNNAYMQQPQQTGYQQDSYGQNPYMQQQQTGYPQAQYIQQQPTAYIQPQQTSYNASNPYAQQQSFNSPVMPQPTGSNNPFAANHAHDSIKPQPTGSNNPFATNRSPQQPSTPNRAPTLSTLQEQRTAMQFSPSSAFGAQPAQQQQPHANPQHAALNALLASGEGQDTFGNTGNMRIPAQHTAPGTFVNSAGTRANQLVAEKTGTNPFLQSQFTGMPQQQFGQPQHQQFGQQQQSGYGMMPMQTGPAGYGGGGYGMPQQNNPFGQHQQPQQQQQQQQQQQGGQGGGSLIDL